MLSIQLIWLKDYVSFTDAVDVVAPIQVLAQWQIET